MPPRPFARHPGDVAGGGRQPVIAAPRRARTACFTDCFTMQPVSAEARIGQPATGNRITRAPRGPTPTSSPTAHGRGKDGPNSAFCDQEPSRDKGPHRADIRQSGRSRLTEPRHRPPGRPAQEGRGRPPAHRGPRAHRFRTARTAGKPASAGGNTTFAFGPLQFAAHGPLRAFREAPHPFPRWRTAEPIPRNGRPPPIPAPNIGAPGRCSLPAAPAAGAAPARRHRPAMGALPPLDLSASPQAAGYRPVPTRTTGAVAARPRRRPYVSPPGKTRSVPITAHPGAITTRPGSPHFLHDRTCGRPGEIPPTWWWPHDCTRSPEFPQCPASGANRPPGTRPPDRRGSRKRNPRRCVGRGRHPARERWAPRWR